MDPSKLEKVILALVISLMIAVYVTGRIFIQNTPRLNNSYIAALPEKTSAMLISLLKTMEFPTPSATVANGPIPTVIPTFAVLPTVMPTIAATQISTSTSAPTFPPRPTKAPISTPLPTKKPSPTTVVAPAACPVTSSKTYSSMRVPVSDPEKLKGDLSRHPEVNLYLRGYGEVNEGKNLISRGGSNYGLDDKMPPQISTLFGSSYPRIIKTYIVYEWDFDKGKSNKPNPATPNYPVHVLGLETTPGKPLMGLKAGREIGGGNVFLVLYATKDYIMFTHSGSDNIFDGYLFYFFDFCTDVNLLAEYDKDVAGGRYELPVIAPGQVFGYGNGGDVKIVVRDTMSFMDTRYREDWWEYGK